MDDPRHVPLYSIPECARYLGLPVSTVRSWLGKPGSDRKVDGKPLIIPAGSDPTALSFTNLVELHVLALLRRQHKASLREVRTKIDRLKRSGNTEAPLASRELLNLSGDQRVELDRDGLPGRYFPFTRGYGVDDPKMIVINPRIRFGRPVIDGSGVSTSAVARFSNGGETVAELADEYRLRPEQIKEAILYERVT